MPVTPRPDPGFVATCPYPDCVWALATRSWESAANALDHHQVTHINRLNPRGTR